MVAILSRPPCVKLQPHLRGDNEIMLNELWVGWLWIFGHVYFDGLVKDCSISIAIALEMLQSCTKPSIYTVTLRVSVPYVSGKKPLSSLCLQMSWNLLVLCLQQVQCYMMSYRKKYLLRNFYCYPWFRIFMCPMMSFRMDEEITGNLAALLSVNLLRPSDLHMHQWTGSLLVEVMVCGLSGTKSLHQPVVTNCQLNPKEYISMKFYLKIKGFYSQKCIWKCHLRYDSHFVQASMC